MKAPLLSSTATRLFSQSVTTLGIEGGSVRLLVAKGRRITDWGIAPLEPDLVADGVVVDPRAVGMHIRSLLASHHVRNGKLVVSLTGQRSVHRILKFPQMNAQLLREAIPREMKREIPVPLDEMYVSWQVIGAENGHLRVFALGVPRDILGPQLEAIKLAGRKPHSMDIKPLALVRAVGKTHALIADLEPESIDVIVVREAFPDTIRTVSLRYEFSEVEYKIRRLAEELARTVKFYSDTHREDPLPPSTPVFLTGSLAEEVASSSVVEASVDHPVEPLSPPLECPPGLPVATFMVNIGLALKEA
jgi:Tfp pilus assembly PilM family ATPase